MCKKLKLIVDFTTVSPSYNARCKICEKRKIEVVVSFTWCPRLYFFFVRFVIELLRDILSELLLTRCLINTFFKRFLYYLIICFVNLANPTQRPIELPSAIVKHISLARHVIRLLQYHKRKILCNSFENITIQLWLGFDSSLLYHAYVIG